MTSLLQNLPKLNEGARGKGKRLGRGYGSGKGAKSTRGTTRHQRAREHIPLAFEGGQNRLVKRFPLLRGKAKNKSVQLPSVTVALSALEVFADGTEVSVKTLLENNIVSDVAPYQKVKVLAKGELSKKLTVKLSVSSKAKELIEAAGGTVHVS